MMAIIKVPSDNTLPSNLLDFSYYILPPFLFKCYILTLPLFIHYKLTGFYDLCIRKSIVLLDLVLFVSMYTFLISSCHNFYKCIIKDKNDTKCVSTSVKSEMLHLKRNGGSIFYDLKHNGSRFFSSYWSLFRSKFLNSEPKSEQKSKIFDVSEENFRSFNKEPDDEFVLLGQDINLVMEKLGIEHNLCEEEMQMKWDHNEISGLFEEEPSLEEVKEAFDVFDQNRDGFIDAGELQRVIVALGLREGLELHECSNMIRALDQNKDGKIDFNEFVGFMLNTFN